MPDNYSLATLWLKRAVSSYKKAVAAANVQDVFYEDLCFDLQQAVEKALKSLLIYMNIEFPKTHSLNVLTSLLMQNGLELPEEIIESVGLTIYAVHTRYPGEHDEVTQVDFEKACQTARKVLEFVEARQGNDNLFNIHFE